MTIGDLPDTGPMPSLGQDPFLRAAVSLGVARVSLADAVRAMIRVAADNPEDVLDRLRRDRDR